MLSTSQETPKMNSVIGTDWLQGSRSKLAAIFPIPQNTKQPEFLLISVS
jgi:hypothetical protein